jgi:hypothetical protein
MRLIRPSSWILLAAAGFALAVAPAGARQAAKDELPKRPAIMGKITELRSATHIPAAELNQVKDVFAAYAKYQAELISTPAVYRITSEFVTDARNPIPSLDTIHADLTRHLLIPEPTGKVTADQADYVRELGVALDAALKKVIDEGPANKEYDQIVKLNATRLLATAARSGAAAHYPTVTGLLKNKDTPPEIKLHALKAAEHLLAAYDINVLTTRKRDHSARPKELVELIQAVEDVIVAPNNLVAQPAAADGDKPKGPTPEELAVIAYIRRQAVRTLGQARFASVTVPPSGPTVYPAHTLARVIYSDPVLNPPPNVSEIVEATLGVCNMSPTRGYNTDAAADVVASGVIAFATPRAARPEAANKDYPWRVYAVRLTDGVRLWKAVQDPAYDPLRPTSQTAPPPAVVAEVADEAVRRVFVPIERLSTDPTAKVDVPGMADVRGRLRKSPKRSATLFREVPATSLEVAPRK